MEFCEELGQAKKRNLLKVGVDLGVQEFFFSFFMIAR